MTSKDSWGTWFGIAMLIHSLGSLQIEISDRKGSRNHSAPKWSVRGSRCCTTVGGWRGGLTFVATQETHTVYGEES